MKIKNLIVSCIAIVFIGLAQGAAVNPQMMVRNKSNWTIGLKDPFAPEAAPDIIIPPNDSRIFRQIPASFTFKTYGEFYGHVTRPKIINIGDELQKAKITSIPADHTLIITITTWMQAWYTEVSLQPTAAMEEVAAAEVAIFTSPDDFFPRLKEKKAGLKPNMSIPVIDEARYILNLPSNFQANQVDQVDNAKERELTRLNELLKKNPMQAEIINKAKIMVQNAAKTLIPRSTTELMAEFLDEALPLDELSTENIEYINTNLITNIESKTGIKFQYMRNPEGLDIMPESTFREQYLRGKLSGGKNSYSLKNHYLNKNESRYFNNPAVLRALVNEYKIHLMPTDDNLLPVTIKLLNAIKGNPKLQNLIGFLKIKPILTIHEMRHQENSSNIPGVPADYYNLPRIVIYVGGGKEPAQQALNEIYNLFKNETGMNKGPGFNEKVTSLIYFAQGNRDDKIGESSSYFEQPGLVYFKSNVTGSNEDYHLVNPSKTLHHE